MRTKGNVRECAFLPTWAPAHGTCTHASQGRRPLYTCMYASVYVSETKPVVRSPVRSTGRAWARRPLGPGAAPTPPPSPHTAAHTHAAPCTAPGSIPSHGVADATFRGAAMVLPGVWAETHLHMFRSSRSASGYCDPSLLAVSAALGGRLLGHVSMSWCSCSKTPSRYMTALHKTTTRSAQMLCTNQP